MHARDVHENSAKLGVGPLRECSFSNTIADVLLA
jgi:hypothetical protein